MKNTKINFKVQTEYRQKYSRDCTGSAETGPARIIFMLQVTWQNRCDQTTEVKQDKTQVIQILTIKAFNHAAEEEQGNHVKQEMSSIRMDKAMRNKAVILSTLQCRWPENQAIHHRLFGESNKWHNTGDQNNGHGMIKR